MIIDPRNCNEFGLNGIAYRPSLPFRNAHFNTMFPYALRRSPDPKYRRERWNTPDGDFFDLDFIDRGGKKVIILLHGLEGSSSSQYILGAASALSGLDADVCAVNHRSCSGEMNTTLGFYHSGFMKDLAFILDKLAEKYEGLAVVGFSLGGNMLLKYLGSHHAIPSNLKTGVAVSVPVDLSSSAVRLNHWTNRPYAIQFLKTLRKKSN
ncbi:MAG: alpha/beta fold hydrolase [Saprospiraceae bacterium]|nr:alpha/beta fold hydrolase [Saprospiraceae bacterium]